NIRRIDHRHQGWKQLRMTVDKVARSVKFIDVLEFLSDKGDLTIIMDTKPQPLSGKPLEDARVTLCGGQNISVLLSLRDVCSQAGAMYVFRPDYIEIVPF